MKTKPEDTRSPDSGLRLGDDLILLQILLATVLFVFVCVRLWQSHA
jgi:hypothetical protein